MFKSRLIVIIVVASLFAIAIGLHFFGGEKRDEPKNITLMPEDVALVIETKNFTSLLDNFNTKNQFKRVFSSIHEWSDFFKLSATVDDIIKTNADIKNIFDNNKLTMAARVGINKTLEFVYSVPVYDSDDENLILETISSYRSGNKSINKQVYENKDLYNFNQVNPAKRLFSYAIVDGVFIISKSKSLVEEAIRQLVNPEQNIEHLGFEKVAKTADIGSDMNVYINYAYFPNMFKSVLSNRKSNFYNFLKQFADWTELNVRYKNKSLFMSGITYVNHSKKRYLKVLKDQESLPNNFIFSLPKNTAAFIALNISNPLVWQKNYDIYLKEMGTYMSVKANLDSISKKFLPDVKNLFFSSIKGAVCVAWIDKKMSNKELEAVGIVELRNAEHFANILRSSKKNNDNDTTVGNYEVFNMSEPRLFKYLFGDAFSELKTNYCMVYDGKLIAAKSVDALKFYLRKLTTLGTLQNSKNFKIFSSSLSSESNIYAYLNFNLSNNILLNSFNRSSKSLYKRNIERFNSVYALAIQYGVAENAIYTNFCTHISSRNIPQRSKNSWELKLDTRFDMKPAVVKNHATGNKEILIQDKSNKLSFISASGQVRWTKQLDSKILGKIHQVDKYRNKKIQYLFNTLNKIYLLDRNGDNVEGFPIPLKSQATNSCAVFDYDNNGKYRILVASADKQMQMYDIDGKPVSGWEFKKTNSIVKMPVQHFADAGKDYLIFADYNNTYIVDRKGTVRVTPQAQFQKNANTQFFFEKSSGSNESRFVALGEDSYVYFIYLDGSVKKMQLGNFSTHNKFMYVDINGNGKKQFVVTDENVLYVFNRDKTVNFKLEFKHDLKNSLNVYRFGQSLYLGVSPVEEHKIYLINPEGKIINGFPLSGSGEFSISKLDKKDNNNRMDIITGNADKYLFNYQLLIN